MRRGVNAETPLIIAVQPAKTRIPNNFKYTCACRLKPSGIFKSDTLNYDQIIAAGTREGPIVIFGEKSHSLSAVSLLCAHSYSVTDIVMTLSVDTFVSISRNSVICGWSCLDSGAIFKHQLPIPYDNHKLALAPSDEFHIWVWSLGSSSTLIDLKSGAPLITLPFFGLTSFANMTSYSFCLAPDDIALCVGFSKATTYSIDKQGTIHLCSQFDLISKPHSRIIANECGIIRLDGLSWSLLRPECVDSILDGSVTCDDGDSLCDATWDGRNCICLATFGGSFFVIKIHRNPKVSEVPFSILSISSFKGTHLHGCFSYSSELGVIFSSAPDILSVIYPDSSISSFSPSEITDFYHSPDSMSFIHATSDSMVEIINNAKPQNVEFLKPNAKLTSIFSRYSSNGQSIYQIYAGYSDGNVVFFSLDYQQPAMLLCLPSKVVAFVGTPIRINGRQTLIAIGEDGTTALLKWNEVHTVFESSGFAVTSIYFLEGCLFVGRYDGSYLAFEADNPSPIYVLTEPPPKSTELFTVSQTYSTSSLSLRCGCATTVLSCYNLTQMYSISKKEPDSSVLSEASKLATSMFSDDSNSFVLIGASMVPTFFYEPLCGNSLYCTSPFQAACFYVSYHMLMCILNTPIFEKRTSEKYFDFLPILAQMLYVPSKKVQRISFIAFADLSDGVPVQKSMELASQYTEQSPPEQLLLAMLASFHPQTVRPDLLRGIYEFILKWINNSSYAGIAALLSCIQGFGLWSQFDSSKDKFCLKIISSIPKQKENSRLKSAFFQFGDSEPETLMRSLFFYARENDGRGGATFLAEYSKIIKLVTEMTMANPLKWDSRIALVIAHISVMAPPYYGLLETFIPIHAKFLQNVVVCGNVFLIGDERGELYFFRKGKLVVNETLFNEKIDMISAGEDNQYAIAICQKLKVGKIFSLEGPSILKRLKVTATTKLPESNIGYEVKWTDVSHCEVTSLMK